MDKLSFHIGSEISLKDFSFSQLIIAVKHLFDTEGIPGLVKVLVVLLEQTLIRSGVECPHCKSSHLHKHSESSRTVKTSIGEVMLKLSRLTCVKCKKSFVPFNQLLDLNKYSRKSREFEKLSLETITNQSFRRSAKNLSDTLGFNTSHTTLHRWFNKTDAVNTNVNKKVDYLIADATGFKRAKPDEFDTNKGSIKVLIGYNKDGEVIPFGAWTRASWKDIGKYVKSENHTSDKVKFKTIARTLITDGEEEIVRQLKKLANSHQRCLFHMTHELTPLLRYKDIVGKDEAIKLSEELNELLYLDLPEADADPLKSLEDKLKIEIKLKDMKEAIEAFIKELHVLGYR